MGKVAVAGGKVGMEAPSTINPVFIQNTWEQIINACQNNKVPDTWNVGDSKTMTINGTDYQIDIIGMGHDTYSDGSGKAPLTFQMHDCYDTKYGLYDENTNVGGWTESKMRTTHLPAILKLMPTEVQTGIKEVNKLTSGGNQGTTIFTTEDKLFLLSEIEVFGKCDFSASGEGTQYDYYKAGNSKVKNLDGSAYYWWLRSPILDNIFSFCGVNSSAAIDQTGASTQWGVAFAFCF